MKQKNSNDGKKFDFFHLYAVFLKIDSVNSFIYGRNRVLIQQFYDVYYLEAMYKGALKSKASRDELKTRQSELKEKEKLVRRMLAGYVRQRGKHRIRIWVNPQMSSTYPCIVENPNISEAFLCFVDAVEQYETWRSNLNNEQLLVIYRKNLEDRQKHYGGDECFKGFNEELLQKIDISKLTNNKMLKQTLIELHNAISHLVAAYYGRNQERNKERAINHFKRGALDSYKAIIKDFYFLTGQKPMEPIVEDLKNLRKCEYQTIGDNKRGFQDDLYKKYQDFTTEIIKSLKPNES